MESGKAGHLMSLAALQRQDPYINQLLDVTGQVALYTFNSKANEWEKTEIEGTLFVYSRSASPRHGFTIMNRLSTENLVEPINKDLEFQLQDPFLLYRNANLGIYSIWFYDKKDCQRIAQLMVKIVKEEAELAHRASPDRAGPGRTNGVVEPRPIDILELLSKAKEEYNRTRTDAPSTVEEIVQPVNATEHAQCTSHPETSAHSVVKQITVEELFGSSLPRDPSLPAMPAQSHPSFPQDQPYVSPGPRANHHHLRRLSPGLLPPAPPSPYAPPPGPSPRLGHPQPRCSVSPQLVPPPAAYMGGQGGLVSPHKSILAPGFLPSALVPPHSFQAKEIDSFCKSPGLRLGKPLPTVSLGPGLSAPRAVLLSPSAFQHSVANTTTTTTTTTVSAAAGLPPSAAPPGPPVEPPAPGAPGAPGGGLGVSVAACSKTQLQEALVHLIKNDPAFLGAIHEAYLQGLSRDLGGMRL